MEIIQNNSGRCQWSLRALEIIWNPQIISLENYHANRHFIQANFHLIGIDIHGLLTNVYFPQNLHQKTELLDNMAELNKQISLPLWLLRGDFNMIKNIQEKK